MTSCDPHTTPYDPYGMTLQPPQSLMPQFPPPLPQQDQQDAPSEVKRSDIMQTLEKWMENVETNLIELKRKYEESANFIQMDHLMEDSEAIPIMHKIIEARRELCEHWTLHKTSLLNLKENCWQLTPQAIQEVLTKIVNEARIQTSKWSKDMAEDEKKVQAIAKDEKAKKEEQMKKEKQVKEKGERDRRKKIEEERETHEREREREKIERR